MIGNEKGEDVLRHYDYDLPEELIARAPSEPRDAARLFVYDTAADAVSFDIFRNVGEYLPPRSLVILNDTKVFPARIAVRRETGGKVELLLFVNEYREGDRRIKGMADRKVALKEKLYLDTEHFLTAVSQDEHVFLFEPGISMKSLFRELERRGQTPIPKYIKGTPLPEKKLRDRYQSIFARHPASIAAPTASLHLTDRVFRSFEERGIGRAFVTLSVGLGTFAPVSERDIAAGKLHAERYEVPSETAEKIAAAKRQGRPVIAVGTTVMRTLETLGHSLPFGHPKGVSGETGLFIRPPFRFQVADALLTNFHLPRSSLLMLADAFLEHKRSRRRILALYDLAVRERFRFYSFGDAMLIQ